MNESATASPLAFASLIELQDAHDALLDQREQLADDTGSPEFWCAVNDLARRAQATGAWLDASRDRRAAQSILDFWTNALFRAGQPVPVDRLADFDPTLAPELPDTPSPYQGLAAFDEASSPFFFGRDRLTAEMIARLGGGARLLAVTGASGSGKSSVVLAGLLPALRAGALAGSDSWRVVVMTPGSKPAASLQQALSSVAPEGETLLLVVDQFEETFTLCHDEAERAAFVAQLLAMIDEATPAGEPSTVVVLTMRSDFVDVVAKAPALWPLFRAARMEVETLDINELRAAIEKPAEKVGLKFDEGIVDDLITTILGERAGLPLLQFTLLKLWEKRERNRVTRRVYEEVGNPRQALERSAEAFFTSLIPEEQATAKRILLKMVRPGEGREVTSNRILLSEVYREGEARDRIERVLDRLINEAHLVKLSMRESSEDEQVEVAHEALIRNWPRLVAWLDAEREELRQRFLLAEAARQWEQLGRPTDSLWRGRLLEEVRAFGDLNELEREFVAAGEEQVRLEREQEIARQVELSRAHERAIQQSRRIRRLRWLVVALIILALIPTILILVDLRLRESPWLPVENLPQDDVIAIDFSEGKGIVSNVQYCIGMLELGVACSIDGVTWNIYQQGLPTGGLENAPATSLRGANALSIDRTNPDTIYVFQWGKGVSKSANGGISWSATGLMLPEDGVTEMAAHNNWVAAVVQDSVLREEELYVSEDGGAQWAPVSRGDGAPIGEVHDVEFIPANDSSFEVYLIVAADDGLYRGSIRSADEPWIWERLAEVTAVRFVAVGDSFEDGVVFAARRSDEIDSELYHWRIGGGSQRIATFTERIRALSPRIAGQERGAAYLLLDNEEIFAVNFEGEQTVLGKPATSLIDMYYDDIPYGYDLTIIPSPDGDGEWLLLGSSIGLLYQPAP